MLLYDAALNDTLLGRDCRESLRLISTAAGQAQSCSPLHAAHMQAFSLTHTQAHMLAHTRTHAYTCMHMALTSSHCFNRINLSRTIALHREAAASSAASTTETTSGGTAAPESEFLAVKDVKESVEPMAAVKLDLASEAQWRAVGYSAVLNGSVAVVTLAGGQGESVFRRATVRAGGVVGVVQNVVSVPTGVGGVVKDEVWCSLRSFSPLQL